MRSSRRVRTILYGDQAIEVTELDLLHTPALQRLYDLHQLGLTDRVFIDASHSRLQHVIGVLEQVDKIIDALSRNLERADRSPLKFRSPSGSLEEISPVELRNYVRTRRRAARLMGLLHDITHAPFGHTLEDEIELQEQKHDHPDRQARAFYRLLVQYIGWLAIDEDLLKADTVPGSTQAKDALARLLEAPVTPEFPESPEFIEYLAHLCAYFLRSTPTSRWIARAPTHPQVVTLLQDLRFAMRALLWLDDLHKDRLSDLLPESESRRIRDDGEYPFERVIDRALALVEKPVSAEGRFWLPRDAFFLDIIGNTICADLLDYAKRDSHFAGLKLDYDIDRIVENFTIVSYRRPRDLKTKMQYTQIDPLLRTAISIFSHKLRIDVPGELMNLLQVRFYVYQRVLFHPTKCIAGAMLGAALQLIGWRNLPEYMAFVGDAVFLAEVGHAARLGRELLRNLPKSAGTKVGDHSEKLTGSLDVVSGMTVSDAVRAFLQARSDEMVYEVVDDLTAAIRLLDRLTARRYHRQIFRLLPNSEVRHLNFDAEHIAPFFLIKENRFKAERMIELKAELPRGSVTIHCPNAQGPRKIAEILILSDQDGVESAYPLRQIAKIDREIFDKHQSAITAVEEMYRSMWRLIVSVAPPHHQDYARVNPIIGRVLYAILSGENYDVLYPPAGEHDGLPTVSNDVRQDRELDTLAKEGPSHIPLVRLSYEDGREEIRSEWEIDVADGVIPLLRDRVPEIEGHLLDGRYAAHSPEEVRLHDILDRSVIDGSGTEAPLDDRSRRRKRRSTTKQDEIFPDVRGPDTEDS